MRLIRFLGIAVLAFEIPVPIYWLILHAPVSFWRRHIRAAFLVAVAAAWGIVDSLLYRFRFDLFRGHGSVLPAPIGLALIAFDVWPSPTAKPRWAACASWAMRNWPAGVN